MSSLKCLAGVKSSHFLSSVIIKHSLAFITCVFIRNMIIIFHEDFEGDMKPGRRIWGSGSKQGNNIHTLTHCLYQTPALFVVAREKQNNLDFHSSYPSGWKYLLFRDSSVIAKQSLNILKCWIFIQFPILLFFYRFYGLFVCRLQIQCNAILVVSIQRLKFLFAFEFIIYRLSNKFSWLAIG